MKICRESPDLVKIAQEYRALYMQTEVRYIVASHIKLPQKRPLLLKWYQTVRIPERIDITPNAAQCYVLRTLTILFHVVMVNTFLVIGKLMPQISCP
jgi:hypothetical protein